MRTWYVLFHTLITYWSGFGAQPKWKDNESYQIWFEIGRKSSLPTTHSNAMENISLLTNKSTCKRLKCRTLVNILNTVQITARTSELSF